MGSFMQLKSLVENNIQLKSERGQKSRAVFARVNTKGVTAEQVSRFQMISCYFSAFGF
jgi:hypothetical protein